MRLGREESDPGEGAEKYKYPQKGLSAVERRKQRRRKCRFSNGGKKRTARRKPGANKAQHGAGVLESRPRERCIWHVLVWRYGVWPLACTLWRMWRCITLRWLHASGDSGWMRHRLQRWRVLLRILLRRCAIRLLLLLEARKSVWRPLALKGLRLRSLRYHACSARRALPG